MYKKLLIGLILAVAFIFSFGTCFANNAAQTAINDVRNVVGGAESTIENAAKGVSNASKNATGAIEKGANNVTNNGIHNNNNNHVGTTKANANARTNGYTTTRTATTRGANTFMGMTSNVWTWLIIGIAAIAIVALVWYYSMQVRSSDYDNRD